MKTPPLLLGGALLFWGWQTGFLMVGAAMALVLESAHWIKVRWELSDVDFSRIWTFCGLLLLASAVYAFTANDGPADMRNFFQDPSFLTQRTVGSATSKAAAAWLRWLPMILFLFVAAQNFSPRAGIPLETISLILQRRWRQARKLGQPVPASRTVNVTYPYFGVCLFAASIHASEDTTFFWGLFALLTWALWSQRSRRYALPVWAGALALAVAVGYGGQRGVGYLQRYLDNINPQWFARFAHRRFDPTQSKTALGQIGSTKTSGRIVLRISAKDRPPPSLLREASYRTYKAQTWYAQIRETDFGRVPETPANSGNWPLIPDKTNSTTLRIACYLDGRKALLPLPEGSGRLENLPAFLLSKSELGAVLAEGPGLVIFDAEYGPGPTIDSDANTNEDLSVPPKEIPALDQVISELHVDGKNREQTLQAVERFFSDNFNYSTWQGFESVARTNETPLSRFLLQTRHGHCEYFATATVLLLRQMQIPARYAVGYSVHEGAGKNYVVRLRDAHAWCLAWNDRTGAWQDVDTTPASWAQVEADRASALQFLSDFWARIGFEFSKFRWGQTRLRQYFLWALLPIFGLLLYQILFRSHRRRKRRQNLEAELAFAWPGLDSEFYQLEKQLEKQGITRRASEPLSEWLVRALANPGLAELKPPLQQLLHLHYRYRFDPQGLTQQDRETLRGETRACLRMMEKAAF